MKTFAIALLVVGAISTQAQAESRTQCNAEILNLKKVSAMTDDRFAVGEVTRTDTADATLNLIAKQLSCGTILIDAFCAQAPVLAKINVDGTVEESGVAQRTSQEVAAAKQRQIDIQDLCR